MTEIQSVGVNLLWLDPGVVGGSEEYTLRLLFATDDILVERSEKDGLKIRLYVFGSLLDAYPELAERFECVLAPSNAERRAGSKGRRIALEQSWLANVCRSDHAIHHAGGTIPLLRTAPPIVTIHDLQPLEEPQNFSPLKRRWLGAMVPRSARSARYVICPSAFTAHQVGSLLGVSDDRLRVVSHGHAVTKPGVLDSQAHAENRRTYGDFLLYPAISYPHKRHCDVISAVARLASANPGLNLVLTGRPGPEHHALVSQSKAEGVTDRVHFLGRVSAEDLDNLYRSALATVIPSSYEGFGNPALEAMVRGCPVVVADATALPEVVGEAGLKVPVADVDAWAVAVETVAGNPALRAQLVEAGISRAADFPWSSGGQKLLDVYRRAVQPFVRSSG